MSAIVPGPRSRPLRGWQRLWRPQLPVESLVVLASAYFALLCNGSFWRAAMQAAPGNLRLALALGLLLVGVHCLLLGLLAWRWNARWLLCFLLLASSFAAYFMDRYHVYVDVEMMRNVLATDARESRELLVPSLLAPLLQAGVACLLVARVRLPRLPPYRALGYRAALLAGALAAIAGSAALASQDLAALLRNRREVRYLATPANLLYALPHALAGNGTVAHAARLPIGTDATATPRAPAARPRLLVIVVGETVRAASWGLDGYARQTTPRLAAMQVVSFTDVESCGTSTEVSLPCMFSPWGRKDYDRDRIRAHQSLLHVLEHAGIRTLWRDNQSGCKGVCEGLAQESMGQARDPGLCANGRCQDGILLQDLAARARAVPGDRVIVLHPLGVHGPAYFERYPPAFRHFTPTCDTPDLGHCSREQIRNSYDNGVLYTDHVLASTIETLADMQDYDTALLYVSDHGESLGEKGLYLHGVPRAIAPPEQTRVPMLMWFSAGFASARGIDLACLRRRARAPASHDNLFSSVLDLMQVHTTLYQPAQDLFAGCFRPPGTPPPQ